LRGPKAGHTPDLETLRLYEDGRWHYSMLTPEHHVLALKSLTQAVQRDPQFLQPYAEMAALYAWAMLPEVTNDTVRLLRTREIADKALAVDPNQAEGHIALSWCRFLERDWRAAEDEIVRAIQLNPRVAIAHDIYSFYLTMLERYPEAHREAQRAEEVETSASKRTSAIVDTWPFIGERRFDLAEARLKQVLEMDENFAWGHLYLGFCYQDQFKYLESLDEFKKYDVLAGPAQAKLAPAYDAVRQAYESQGEQGYWRKVIEITLAQRVIPADQRLVSELFNETYFGGYYAKLGEKQKALDELEKHFDEVNVWNNIKFEPIYDNLHGEPRYHALVRRAKLQP
jgi:tetratricopeptide (TPR) repeat protein